MITKYLLKKYLNFQLVSNWKVVKLLTELVDEKVAKTSDLSADVLVMYIKDLILYTNKISNL